MMSTKDPNSLFELQRQYLLQQIKGIQIPGSLYTLVVDETTEQILYRVLRRDQILRIVTSVEKIDAKRKQQTFLEAIYFIDPSVYTLNCIVGDVVSRRYKKGWGLFLPISDSDTRLLQFYQSSKFLNNPNVQNYFDFGENLRTIQSTFHPLESRVFLTDNRTDNSMPIYFNENCSELVLVQIRKVAKSLVNLMVITGEYPLIRFYSPQNKFFYKATRLSELIADEFQKQIDEYARNNHDFPPVENQDKPRSVLLIADRTIDLYAPLLHEFTYQAMAMDIVPSLEREGIYKFQSENEKGEMNDVTSTLDIEDDEDWINLRHLHIIESSELIINKINELVKNNPLMVDRSKATTSSDLMHIVANLKGFDEERKRITLHKTLIDECLDINGDRKLAEFAADFEQTCCAEGVTFEGEKSKGLHDDLIVLLAREDLHVNDKMRLVLIYGLYRGGLIEQDFIKLAKFIGVRDTQMVSLVSRCFYNLHKLGFPIVKEQVTDPKIKKKMFHTINNDGTYNTSRFGPGIKSILQFLIKYQLDEDWFPYFRDKPLEDDIPANIDIHNPQNPGSGSTSLRNSRIKASWAQNPNKVNQVTAKNKQRIFCFVAGGITYSEVRSIYELSNTLQKDFYIGSESILRPRDFLIGLQSIDKAKQMQDLNLNLYKELTSNKEPPLHLFETSERHHMISRPPPNQPSTANMNSSPQYRNMNVNGRASGPQGYTQVGGGPGPQGYTQLGGASLNSSGSTNQSVHQMNIDFNNFNINSPPVNTNVPSHYQKRSSNYSMTNLEPEPAKTKKTSKLKKLFK